MSLRATVLAFWQASIFATMCGITALIVWWPESYWMEVKKVHIDDGPRSASLAMIVDRTVAHRFTGTWIVVIRRWENGGWATQCTASGNGDYKPDAKFPSVLDLKWWTDGKCHPLPVGKYIVTTTWKIDLSGLPDKFITIDSNSFEVTP
jgi:hypothetical protein